MKIVRRIMALIVVVACAALGIVFGKANSDPVTVDYVYFSISRPLAETLAVYFASGLLLGALAMLVAGWWTTRRKVAAARKQEREAAREAAVGALEHQ